MLNHLDVKLPNTRKAINDLEKCSSIYPADKANILLVGDGVKPSMHTALFSDPVDRKLPLIHVNDDDVQELLSIIKNFGLSYSTDASIFENEKYHYDRFVITVSQDQSVAESLMAAKTKLDEYKEGILLGFPETAVRAFINGNMLEYDDETELREYLSHDEYEFLNHRVSKDNWKNEVAYLPTYVDTIRRLSPAIFKQVTISKNQKNS